MGTGPFRRVGSGRVRLGLEDLHLDGLAVRRLVGGAVADALAVDRGAHGGLLGEDLQVRAVGDLAVAEQEGLLVAEDLDGHDHAGLDDTVVGRGLADLRVVEQLGELSDTGLHLALLLARGVVAAVLLEVALLAGLLDLLRDLDATLAGQVVQLRLEAVVGLLRQETTSSSLGHLCHSSMNRRPRGSAWASHMYEGPDRGCRLLASACAGNRSGPWVKDLAWQSDPRRRRACPVSG